MTKKDYELIARSIFVDISAMKTDAEIAGAQAIAMGLAEQLQAMNPRFDRGRFLDACGVNEIRILSIPEGF